MNATVTYRTHEEAIEQFEADTVAGGAFVKTVQKGRRTIEQKETYFYNDLFTWTLCGAIASRKDETTGVITYYHFKG